MKYITKVVFEKLLSDGKIEVLSSIGLRVKECRSCENGNSVTFSVEENYDL